MCFSDASEELLLWRDKKPMRHEDEVHMKRASAGLGQDESHVISLFLLLGDYLAITSRAPRKWTTHQKKKPRIHEQQPGRGPASLMKSKLSLFARNNKMKGKEANAEEHVIVWELPAQCLSAAV